MIDLSLQQSSSITQKTLHVTQDQLSSQACSIQLQTALTFKGLGML